MRAAAYLVLKCFIAAINLHLSAQVLIDAVALWILPCSLEPVGHLAFQLTGSAGKSRPVAQQSYLSV